MLTSVTIDRRGGQARSLEWEALGRGAGSDETGSLLLHIVLLVLLHPPADEDEQQHAQSLVAHLQAQVPVRQEDTGLVRGCGGTVARVLGPQPPGRAALFSQPPSEYVVTTQVRICPHPDGVHFPHSFDSQGHKPPRK